MKENYPTFEVAYDIAKIYIWKQITTYEGAIKSALGVAYDIAKIYIWKQITTLTMKR